MILTMRIILWSLLAHLVIVLITGLIGCTKNNQTFIVFGAHSKKPTATSYKPRGHVVPFSNSGKGRSRGGGKKRVAPTKKHEPKAKVRRQVAAPKKDKGIKAKQENKKATKSKGASQRTLTESADAGSEQTAEKKRRAVQMAPAKKIITPPHEEQKEDAEPSTPEPAHQEEEQPEQVKPDTSEPTEPEHEDQESDEQVQEHDEDVAGLADNFVGSYTSQQLRSYQMHIQHEIERLWSPPVGVKRGTICSISFQLDDQGVPIICEYAKRSGVLIYDLSVMRAARQCVFDKSLWGKQFKVDFRQ